MEKMDLRTSKKLRKSCSTGLPFALFNIEEFWKYFRAVWKKSEQNLQKFMNLIL